MSDNPQTQAIWAGELAARDGSHPLAQPLYQTTVHTFKTLDELDHAMSNPNSSWFYYRYGAPNAASFEAAMAALEHAPAALAVGSGMGAIFLALSAVLKSGDHIVADSKLYGGSYALFVQQLPRFGITTTFVDFNDLEAVRKAVKQTTRMLYFETITNPLLQITDLSAIATLARELSLISCVDATFSTPILCRPFEWGVDLIVHASTKYIGGHSDALGGIVAGRQDLVEAARTAGVLMGVTQSPFDAWLNVRSLKTLPLRMMAHSRNALAVAEWLEKQPQILKVIYPGLASHPQHALAQQFMLGGYYGGMLCFELAGGRPAVAQLIEALQHIPLAPSLADVLTTLTHPASTSHRVLTSEQRANLGVGDGLVRLSVGIEAPDDIIADLEQALKTINL